MNNYLKIILIIITLLPFQKVEAQYWVRGDITITDGDVFGGFQTELEIRINNNAIIDLVTMPDGNSNSPNRRQTVNRAYNGSFPNQVVFYDFVSDVSISPPDGSGDPCYPGGLGGSTTNPVNTDGSLFLGPFGGSNGNTYFGCDEILETGPAQFFQVWKLNPLPNPPAGNDICDEDTVTLSPPGAFGASIRGVRYRTTSMSSLQTLITFPNPISSYTVDLSTLPNLNPPDQVNFQLDYGNGVLSNIVIQPVTGCSPEIIDVDIENPICSYSQGTFSVTFEEPLNGDMLTNIGVVSPGPNGVFEGPFDLGSDDIFIGASSPTATVIGTQFVYPDSLSAGTYKFRYQTNNSNTAEETAPFTITSPPPLEYVIEVTTDLDCFDSNDGAVTITINPDNDGSIGTPPYYYTMDSGSPVSFTGTSTQVSGLGTDPIEFKVFDTNDCTQRQ